MNRMYLTASLALLARLPRRLDGTPPENKPTDPPKPDEQRLTAEEWAAREKTRASQLSSDKLVDELVRVKGENYTLRQKIAPEGGTVLNAAERADWDKYLTFGKPAELGPTLETAKADRQKIVQREKADHLGAVAKAAGWDAGTLADLDQMAGGLEWTVQTIKGQDGNDVQQVTVKDGDKQRDATEFAKERWSKFLPVLEAGEEKPAPEREAAPAPRVPVGGAGGGKARTPSMDEARQRKQASGQYDM